MFGIYFLPGICGKYILGDGVHWSHGWYGGLAAGLIEKMGAFLYRILILGA